MQVLQWLLNITQDQKQPKDFHQPISTHHQSKDGINTHNATEKPELTRYKHKKDQKKSKKPEVTSLDCRNFRYIALLLKRRNTLHHRTLDSLNQRQQQFIFSMKMKKEDLIHGLGMSGHTKADSSGHVGNKVLPIMDSTTSSLSLASTSNADDQMQCGDQSNNKDDKIKGVSNKAKTLSRMKELLRWAAAAKSEKGVKFGRKVLHLRNKSATIKSGGLDEESNDSPKISFRWEAESSCSAASAPPSLKYDPQAHRRGSWITTDDDFVVLEL